MQTSVKLALCLFLLSISGFAQTTFNGSDSHVYWWGTWLDSVTFKQGGANQRVDFSAVGSTIEVSLYGTLTFSISVDGGAPSSVTPPAGGPWTWYTVYTGSDTTHTITITGPNSFIQTVPMVRVTGATPAMATPAGYGQLAEATGNTSIALDGSPTVSQFNNNNAAFWPGAEGGIRFRAAITGFSAWMIDLNNTWLLSQDGSVVATIVNSTSTSNWLLIPLKTGLDGATHDYELHAIGNMDGSHGGGGGQAYICQLMLTGGTGLAAFTPPAIPTIGWYGDSIIAETGIGLTDARDGTGYLTSHPLGFQALRYGVPGAPVTTTLRDGTVNITGGSPDPVVIFSEPGVNDQQSVTAIGTCCGTPGTFSGDMLTMISSIASGVPATTTIVVTGILPNTATNSANRGNYVAAQRAAVAAYMAGSPTARAIFVDTDGWIIPASDTADGLHPNAGGQVKVATQERLIVARVVGCGGQSGGLSPVCSGVE